MTLPLGFSRPLLTVLLFFGLCTAAQAQFRASIQGTVSDPTGAVIPNATLTLTDTDTNATRRATSNGDGVYNFNALAPDHYNLAASAAGFKAKAIQNLRIIPEQANSVNVQLALGEATTSVTVSGDTIPPLDTGSASIQGTVNSNQIQHLPSAGRDVFQLTQLAPGVFGDGSQGGGGGTNNLPGTTGPGGTGATSGIFQTENGPQAVANGNQNETNGIQIDGISTVSAVWGGTSVITPSEDSVGDVKIVSNSYDAENGRFSGAQIQVTSKTGTNQFHGSLFFRANRPGLNAYQRYDGPGSLVAGTPDSRGLLRDESRFNQYGGSVGGPIIKNRLFFFFNYEAAPQVSAGTSTGWYDTAAFDALAPGNSIAHTFVTFPGNTVSAASMISQTCANAGFVEGTNCVTIPGQGLNLGSPLPQALGTQDLSWQSTGNPGVGGGLSNVADIADFTTSNPTRTSDAQYNGRLDADATKKDHLAFAIYWVPTATTDYVGSIRPYNLYHHTQVNDAFSAIWNHTFSGTFLNEARANAAGWRWNEVTSNPQEPFGLPTDQVDTTGSIQVAAFGAPGPSTYNQWTYTYKDVATKVLGNHNVKFGGEATRLYYLNDNTGGARPSFNFYNIWDFLNDAPHTEAGTFDPLTGTPTTNRQDEREDLYGFFIQDDWKTLPNLTINLGLRYSYFGSLSSKEGNLGSVVLGSGAATYTGLSIRAGGDLYKPQKGNFGPQLGFAWTPTSFHNKLAVRGGFGLNFNEEEIAIAGNTNGNPPFLISPSYSSASPAAINPDIVYGIASSPTSLFAYPPNPHTITAFNTANLPAAGSAGLTELPSNLPTIYTYHYSLDTQYDLGHQIVATVGYQGSVSHHVILQSNAYVTAFAQGLAFNPLVNEIDDYANNGGSNNNELLLGLRHQMSHGLQFDAEFQYAKSMDNGSTPYYEDPYPYNTNDSYGRSDYDFGKALKINGLWQPVFFKGSHNWLEKVAGGWSVSGIYNIHTGFPFSPVYNAPGSLYYASSGYTTLRPTAYFGGSKHITSNDAFEQGKPNLNFPSAGPSQPYFGIPTAAIATGAGALATASGLPSRPGVGRNSFTGPGYQDIDATLTKAFGLPRIRGIGEGANIELRADAFNLFNETNLNPATISTNILLSNFGQTSSALGSRTINLQARFSF